MSELVDVACDICGKIYHWTDQRLGDTATCRECGSKFEVVEYIPPSEDDEEESNNNPLPWIKGASVTVLILAVLVGLGSLLFIRPGPAVTPFTASAAPARSGWAPPAQPRPNWNVGVAPKPAVKNWGAQASKTENHKPGFQVPGISPASQPAQTAQRGVTPMIDSWSVDKAISASVLTVAGKGFRKVTLAQVVRGSAIIPLPVQIVSDTELKITNLIPGDLGQGLIMISTAEGMAVLFNDKVTNVTGNEDGQQERSLGNRCFIRPGGRLKSRKYATLMIDSGGQAINSSVAILAFVKQGGELQAPAGGRIFVEPGSKVAFRNKSGEQIVTVSEITFWPLPVEQGT